METKELSDLGFALFLRTSYGCVDLGHGNAVVLSCQRLCVGESLLISLKWNGYVYWTVELCFIKKCTSLVLLRALNCVCIIWCANLF